jgi:hypothetical protein
VSATVARSCTGSQSEILASIAALHCPDGFECDVTFGNGQFYKGTTQPALRFDLEPLSAGVIKADSRLLPLAASSIGSLVFDPPFLTYVREGRTGNGKMAMSRRFGGYWHLDELKEHYQETISEAYRVRRPGGVMVFKCQDIIHNHRMFCTHAAVIGWAESEGFRLRDLFVLTAAHRMPSPNRKGLQRHARVFHSYFLVLERERRAAREAA